MGYEVYYNVFFIGGLVLAAIMLIVSVVIFFVLNIPHVFGDLSGRNAAKAIADIRSKSENTDHGRQKRSDKMTLTGSLKKNPSGRLAKTAPQQTAPQEIPTQSSETTVLSAANETTVLSAANETTVLSAANETTVLNDTGVGETTFLNNTSSGETTLLRANADASSIQIEYEITYIHSDDVIA